MTLRKLNILTVDDELPVAHSIRFALSDDRRVLSMAADGEEAFNRIAAQQPPFDLVITDNNMPRVNGLQLVERLRKASFTGKIIVLSAHLSEEVERAYTALEVDRMLPKPFSVAELRQAVDEVAAAG